MPGPAPAVGESLIVAVTCGFALGAIPGDSYRAISTVASATVEPVGYMRRMDSALSRKTTGTTGGLENAISGILPQVPVLSIITLGRVVITYSRRNAE